MLIIRSGKYKNKRLKEVDPSITRPSKDIVKEGLFNIINLSINNSSFLDLYGGSGQIGFEALSRGASKVIINDINLKSYKVINENRKIINDEINIKDKLFIENLTDLSLIEKYKNNHFDIIFLDPPYIYNNEYKIVTLLKEYNLIDENSLIFIEKESEVDDNLFNEFIIKKYKYGRSLLFLLKSRKEEN